MVKRKKTVVLSPEVAEPLNTIAKASVCNNNPYLTEYYTVAKNWRQKHRTEISNLFCPSISADTIPQLFGEVAEIADPLRERYAWAIPNNRSISVIKSLGSECDGIVEIGAGNGYWASLLLSDGVDIEAFDINVNDKTKNKKRKNDPSSVVAYGGPDVLKSKSYTNRCLFLCYPDGYEFEKSPLLDEGTGSLGLSCLNFYRGDTVIHVGELMMTGGGICQDGPRGGFGRSSHPSFQARLTCLFHCVLVLPLPSWPASRDYLTVWKRSGQCEVAVDDSDDSDGDENDGNLQFRQIPLEEKFVLQGAAPLYEHLLPTSEDDILI